MDIAKFEALKYGGIVLVIQIVTLHSQMNYLMSGKLLKIMI